MHGKISVILLMIGDSWAKRKSAVRKRRGNETFDRSFEVLLSCIFHDK